MNEPERWRRLLREAAGDGAGQARRICDLCVELLGATWVEITAVTTEGHAEPFCASDGPAQRIGELQFSLGNGPCVDALQQGVTVFAPDLRQSADRWVERWPLFLASADPDVAAAFAIPLGLGAMSVGVLGLYRDRPGSLSDEQMTGALLAADASLLLLLHRDRASEGGDGADGSVLPPEWLSVQVHQAAGMVQVQLGVTTYEAVLALRARAFSSNQALTDLAADVVSRRVRFSTEDQ